jgi:beta-lactamase regulating signal transducer with metallopeptidase domain
MELLIIWILIFVLSIFVYNILLNRSNILKEESRKYSEELKDMVFCDFSKEISRKNMILEMQKLIPSKKDEIEVNLTNYFNTEYGKGK